MSGCFWTSARPGRRRNTYSEVIVDVTGGKVERHKERNCNEATMMMVSFRSFDVSPSI